MRAKVESVTGITKEVIATLAADRIAKNEGSIVGESAKAKARTKSPIIQNWCSMVGQAHDLIDVARGVGLPAWS